MCAPGSKHASWLSKLLLIILSVGFYLAWERQQNEFELRMEASDLSWGWKASQETIDEVDARNTYTDLVILRGGVFADAALGIETTVQPNHSYASGAGVGSVSDWSSEDQQENIENTLAHRRAVGGRLLGGMNQRGVKRALELWEPDEIRELVEGSHELQFDTDREEDGLPASWCAANRFGSTMEDLPPREELRY